MKPMRKVLAVLLFGPLTALGSPAALQGHDLRVSTTDTQDVSWITQDEVADAERTVDPSGQAVLRLQLKPEAAQRLRALTGANIGKRLRFTWDGHVVSEMTIRGTFGEKVDLPAPPT